MKLFIPELGTRFKLVQDWTFKIYYEFRNQKFIENFGIPHEGLKTWRDWYDAKKRNPSTCTLPIGTILEIDRIYIRKGATAFSSFTFRIIGKKNSRFWAKLEDVNKIECELESFGSIRWPNGRFSISTKITKKKNHHPNTTIFKENGDVICELHWHPYKNGRFSIKGIGLTNYKHGNYHNYEMTYILSNNEVYESGFMPNNRNGFRTNHYENLDKFMAGAKRMKVPQFLLERFINKYNYENRLS